MGEDDDGPPGRDDRLPTKPAAVVGVTLPPLRWWRSGGGVGPRTLLSGPSSYYYYYYYYYYRRWGWSWPVAAAEAPATTPTRRPHHHHHHHHLSLLPAPVDSSPRAVDKEPLRHRQRMVATECARTIRKRCRDDDRCGDRRRLRRRRRCRRWATATRCLFSLTNLVAPG